MESINRLQKALLEDTPKRLSKLASILKDSVMQSAEMYGSASQPAPPEVVKGVLGFAGRG